MTLSLFAQGYVWSVWSVIKVGIIPKIYKDFMKLTIKSVNTSD